MKIKEPRKRNKQKETIDTFRPVLKLARGTVAPLILPDTDFTFPPRDKVAYIANKLEHMLMLSCVLVLTLLLSSGQLDVISKVI